MKKQNPQQDERITAQRRKIQSDGFGILFFVLLISVGVQQFFFDAPIEQYAVEFICLLGMSFYMIIRYLILGLNLYNEGKWVKIIPLISSITTGIATTVIHGVLNYTRYREHYESNISLFIASIAVFFISITFFTFIALSFLSYLNKKRQAKIQKQLDDSEQDG